MQESKPTGSENRGSTERVGEGDLRSHGGEVGRPAPSSDMGGERGGPGETPVRLKLNLRRGNDATCAAFAFGLAGLRRNGRSCAEDVQFGSGRVDEFVEPGVATFADLASRAHFAETVGDALGNPTLNAERMGKF